MKTKQSPPPELVRKKRAASELARGVHFLVSLRDSLEQSRTQGITLAEVKRRLAERLSAGEPGRKSPRRSNGARRRKSKP
jgi:hypothetical protein